MLDNTPIETGALDHPNPAGQLRLISTERHGKERIDARHLSITFERVDKLIRDFQVELYDSRPNLIGQFGICAMTLEESRRVVEELLGLGKAKVLGDIDPTLKAIELVHACLRLCESRDLNVTSDLGTGAEEIAAEFADRATSELSVEHHRKLLQVKEIAPGIFHVSASTNYQLASTFLRFQEHFESPKFRGKVFDLPEYKKWYASQSETENFSYYQDWGGFNLPDFILDPFRNGEFGALTNKEKALLSYFKQASAPFYIIGISDDSASLASTVRHELAHALFYLNKNYREEVRAVLSTVPTRKIQNYLRRKGYHENSIEDETHAYLLESISDLVSAAGIDAQRYAGVSKKLAHIFRKYFQKRHQ